MDLTICALRKSHKKSNFNCGHELLNNYIQKQARQDVNRDLSACYVINDEEENIVGYYTLSGNSISRNDFPKELTVKLPPSYNQLPTVLLGRLAVDNKYKGNGLGKVLLINALKKCVEISKAMGLLAVIVDPIDESAAKFYANYGFVTIPSNGKMFVSIKTVEELLMN
ncbi:MAG: GNAT family N-acetyltransferase [Flavobacterium sp. JAD_PAG50586_2]|nr:MAG: GNAT family N-acetyltransferase [Flavobacterium sp. JAD_PAG50586_2]